MTTDVVTTSSGSKSQAVANIQGPRLPYPEAVSERFGIDRSAWKALVEVVYTNAKSADSVVLVLAYCKSRKLDPFKRVVHIVPIWNKEKQQMVDTVWPGIGELRTTAFRTGSYAGKSDAVFGPDVTRKIGRLEITFPEWAQVTCRRFVGGSIVDFAGPRVYWLETYATAKRDDDTPNEMWANRPRGQIEKCAEAAALRAAFPEEIGGDISAEEINPYFNAKGTIDTTASDVPSMKAIAARLEPKAIETPSTPPKRSRLDWQAELAAAETIEALNDAARRIEAEIAPDTDDEMWLASAVEARQAELMK